MSSGTNMSNDRKAFVGCQILDGYQRHQHCALLVDGDRIRGVVTDSNIPPGYEEVSMPSGLICPGFVDVQVNGGGGVLMNDAPSVETIQTICDTHLRYGTTALLPTMITDSDDKIQMAISATQDAIAEGIDGVLGLHLEGPHLSQSRKGAHPADLIRAMRETDLSMLVSAAISLPSLMVTLATESVTSDQIFMLNQAGAILSLGHTDASFAEASLAARQGVRSITHLFNAMSPLTSRAPGVVGAALQIGGLSAGLIADGHHVDPVTIDIALRAKRGPGKIFLVTDAMSTVGTDLKELRINNRLVRREQGKLTLEDGTLAGADLNMLSAVTFMINEVGVSVDEALRMASLYPAILLRREKEVGQLLPGAQADFIHLDEKLNIEDVWRRGKKRPS